MEAAATKMETAEWTELPAGLAGEIFRRLGDQHTPQDNSECLVDSELQPNGSHLIPAQDADSGDSVGLELLLGSKAGDTQPGPLRL
eukprot:scaffold441032_cov15-Prasinocladus_malaysianus.AAC.1